MMIHTCTKRARGTWHQHECEECGTAWEHRESSGACEACHCCSECGAIEWIVSYFEDEEGYSGKHKSRATPRWRLFKSAHERRKQVQS
jgi:hypothetical protein